MKTLDEVIKAYEICIGYYCSNAEHDVCPYFGESDMGCMKEPEKDALHYLKAFRDAKDTLEAEKDRYAEAVRNCELAENKYRKMEDELNDIRRDFIRQMKNEPLTWDELRQMEGKPIWVECMIGHREENAWRICLHVDRPECGCEDAMYTIAPPCYRKTFKKSTIGKTRNAYRRNIMKTLDEVINALALCTDWDADCQGCPYRNDNKGGLECQMRNLEEVLHYLKQLQDIRNILPDKCISYCGHNPVIQIGEKYFAVREYMPTERTWRCHQVETSPITGTWVCCDDDNWIISNKAEILYREVGWDLRKETWKGD